MSLFSVILESDEKKIVGDNSVNLVTENNDW